MAPKNKPSTATASIGKRSTRSSTLTGDSPSPPKAKRQKKSSTKLSKKDEEEEDENADHVLARQLQRQEKGGESDDDEVRVMSGPGPKTSAAAAATRSRRSNKDKKDAPTESPAPDAPIKLVTTPFEITNKADLTDPKSLLSPHRELFLPPGACTTRKCDCGANNFVPNATPSLSEKLPLKAFLILGSTTCRSCSKHWCRGCWEVDDANPGVHCAAQRAVILYEILASLDIAYTTDRLRKPPPPVIVAAATTKSGKVKGKAAPKKKATKAKAAAGAGVGYGGGGGMGMGFGGGMGVGGMMMGFDDDDDMDDMKSFDEMEEMEDYMDVYGHYPPGYQAKPKAPKASTSTIPEPITNPKELAQDVIFLSALQLVSSLLPHPESSSAEMFDYLPHESMPSLILTSTLPDLLTDLLRNDSVSEWIRKASIYFTTLEVLTGFSESEITLKVLFGNRRDKKWTDGIGAWIEGEGDVQWEFKTPPAPPTPAIVKPQPKGRGKKRKLESDDEAEKQQEEEAQKELEPIMTSSLFTFLKRLITQAEAFRKAATTGEFASSDSELLGLCGDISSAGDRCRKTLAIWNAQEERNGASIPLPLPPAAADEDDSPGKSKGKGKGKGKGKAKAIETPTYTDEQYASACRVLAYDSVTFSTESVGGGKSFLSHHYRKEIENSASSARPHGGFVHLAKELAVLSTNLPPGIFLRVDEARIDCIKAIICGPEGTPYAGGLFEFDIFVPLQYPQVPPQVWLKSTGANTVRFNPNLYAEGKVCLSLLGTWAGRPDEMWQPGNSTLLQVLISIQSMILGTNFPYFNEPGFGAPKDSKANKDYNANVSLACVRHAMLYWIEDTYKEGIWGDVIAMHFTLNRASITSQVATWAAKDARMKRWLPVYNHLAGTEAASSGAMNHQMQHALAAQGLGGMEGGGYTLAGGKIAQPSNKIERDLVKELEEGFTKIDGWRDKEFWTSLFA